MAKAIYTDVNLDAMGTSPPPSVTRPDPEKAPAQPAGASALMPEDFTGKGPLLEEPDDKKVFKTINDIVESQEQLAKNRDAARKWRAAIRAGQPFAELKKSEDRSMWEFKPAPGGSTTPVPNEADALCRKIASQVGVDLPQPDPKPATDSEQDRGAADLAKRFLKVDGDESGTHDSDLFRDALDSSQTDASHFAHVWVDTKGAGWRPKQIMAHPQALDATNPLVAIDPNTGMEAPTADYVLRYVNGAQFVETAAEAERQWLPRICRDVMGPQHVRTVPESMDVATAPGVILLDWGPVSKLKRQVPELDESVIARLAEWKPKRHKMLVPEAMRYKLKEQASKGDGLVVDDNTLVFWLRKYCDPKLNPDYPDGADIIVTGVDGGIVLKKGTLRHEIPSGEDVRVLLRTTPVSQCRALNDSESRDPFGKAPIDLFGSTNEGLSQLFGAVLEDTDHRLHPNLFLPSTSPVQRWQIEARSGEPIPVLGKEDLPMYEEFADLATFTPQIIEAMKTSMRESAGLGDTAAVLNSPNSQSGISKQLEVSQAKVFLSPISQNFSAYAKRYWRIKLEMAQAFLTIPQEVEYVGLDQAYKQRWFTGADFGGVKDVAIMAGTGTLMSPTEKQQFLSFSQQAGWIDMDEAGEAGRSTVSDDLGLQSMPAEDAIKRELAQWMQGPPEGKMDEATGQEVPGWTPAQPPPVDPTTQQPAIDPATGQPMQGQPASWTPFLPRITDEDPAVAKRQYKILRDFTYTNDYSQHPPEWRALVDERVQLAMYSAGIQTMRQQAEAAAQQQEAERQDKAAQLDANRSEKSADRELKQSEGAANRAMKAQPGAIAA
jgi:hypothetical protein